MEEGALFGSGFDGGGPFRVTPEAGGVSLESALRDYGPAAIDDLIPRLRAIARALDAAHVAGHVHGALHPSKVIVHDNATSLIKGSVPVAPYAAPEMADGPATPASDQYGLAAIAYEWLFGRPIDRPAERPVEVRGMPGVDRVTLSKTFTGALAPKSAARFASCNDFCSAVADAQIPELPLLALDSNEDDDPVGPFIPEEPLNPAPNLDDIDIVAEESRLADLDTITPALAAPLSEPLSKPISEPLYDPLPAPVASWDPAMSSNASRAMAPQRFGPLALFLAVLVGALFGFAAGYMARPRALQTNAPQEIATAPGTEAPVAAPQAPGTASPPAPKAPAPQAPQAPVSVGRLLVRSSPSGATVSLDGTERGVTPLTLRDLAIGSRTVVIARRGFIPETRRVVITNARPARTLDVRLGAAAAPAQRPSTPATLGKPAASTGSLTIESRPTGATVTVNGRANGTTPVTINDLAPGEYRVVMTMQGFRDFATIVRVVAGERARAAASLTALEQE